MKRVSQILAVALISIFAASSAFADTTIYLMRHAEKQRDGTQNPALTEAGSLRAEALAKRLATAGLVRIYSTDYTRTKDTAAPSAKAAGLTTEIYPPNALAALATTLKTRGETALVTGHSNTIPVLANLLAGTKFPLLEDHQYDHLYIVTVKDDGSASVTIDYIEPRTP
jgi:broad specificity phosphatase PhoE